MKVCVLASGSRGNCILVQTGATRILIDAGLSARQTDRRLGQLGLKGEDIDGVLIGHEHGDHIRGLEVLARKWSFPVFMNRATADAVVEQTSLTGKIRIFTNGQSWTLGDLGIEAFPVYHDAQDPVGFSIRHEGIKLVVATDLGMASRVVRQACRGARVIILEANHDRSLLVEGSRPWSLKQRIKSSRGHLSNEEAGELLSRETDHNLTDVFLAHLSRDCNRPELALRVIKEKLKAVKRENVRIRLTYQDRISEVVEVREEIIAVPRESAPSTYSQMALPLS